VFDARGTEIVKFSGYIPPGRMISLLKGIIDDPAPGPSIRVEAPPAYATETALSPALRRDLEDLLVSRYDPEYGGWGFVKKFLDSDAVEYSLRAPGSGTNGRRAGPDRPWTRSSS
jgi:hypothetical protein